ncbi:MAG: hypothetical protein QG640_211 [Patescibacteria group bacterium]|nr:hypothetical protein [Patescibacteria group bacterium]
MKYFSSQQKGFTLVEMIVSLAIFTIVAVVAVGALLKITDANRKGQSLKTAINNLNFALESMSREMRVGVNYAADSDITFGGIQIDEFNDVQKNGGNYSGDWVVGFNTSKTADMGGGSVCNLVHLYKYDSALQSIMKAEQTGCGEDLNSLVFHQLVSPDVRVVSSVLNVVSSDTEKPKVFFWLKGYTGERTRERTEFELQTTVSQRVGT